MTPVEFEPTLCLIPTVRRLTLGHPESKRKSSLFTFYTIWLVPKRPRNQMFIRQKINLRENVIFFEKTYLLKSNEIELSVLSQKHTRTTAQLLCERILTHFCLNNFEQNSFLLLNKLPRKK